MSALSSSSAARSAPNGYALLQAGGLHVLVYRRSVWAALLLGAALLILSAVSLSTGSAGMSPVEAVMAAFGVGPDMQVFLIQHLRLPRWAAGVLSGFAFGVGGCLLQTLARNRLATPSIIGIDDGASAFAVASIVAVPTSLAPSALALWGAATAAVLVFALSAGAGARGYRFIVVGIAVGVLFGAITNLMLARTGIDSANQAYPWTVGSLNARPALSVWLLASGVALCLPAAKYVARALNQLRLSDAVAIGLGANLARTRAVVLILTVVLTGLAVAVAGPVGLIALAAPEAARHLAGNRGVPVMLSGLAGALMMITADWVGRTLFAPIEIPVGVITAVVGGPYLLWILLRKPGRGMA
ncbi:FecCD family ABC transporter permease [Pusillimonas sp.]|uniref:FecCD family ABC transporter permease n=1 Tax=Pusillimonas sp. TaxID=3040095 RepID=UPI0037CB838E